MLREALTIERLTAMGADEAAAFFVARRAEGLTAQEEELLSVWLATETGAAAAVDRADRAWNAFADVGHNEILAAMRAHALAPPMRPNSGWGRGLATAAAIVGWVPRDNVRQ